MDFNVMTCLLIPHYHELLRNYHLLSLGVVSKKVLHNYL